MKPFDLERDTEVIGTGKDVIIYAHGFGVKRDSRGMFTDIARYFAKDYTSILVDLNQVEGEVITLRPLSQQAAIIHEVFNWARKTYRPGEVNLIGHSMGCLVTSLAAERRVGSVVFLASPMHAAGDGLRKYFSDYPAAQMIGEMLTIPRRDGTTTRIGEDYFAEMTQYHPAELVMGYAALHELTLIEAMEEDVIREADYAVFKNRPGIELRAIHGDHNFTGEGRPGLLLALEKLLGA